MRNQFPTKDYLFKRGILGEDDCFCVGGCVEESVSRLFFECPFFEYVWVAVAGGIKVAMPNR